MTDHPDNTTASLNADELRASVVERYSGLARQALAGETPIDSCGTDACGPGEQDDSDTGCFGAAQNPPADAVPETALRASLGCGNPLTIADIRPGETVLDLGSGGGLDVILSARRTGPTGKACGLDASPDMLTLARSNATQAQATNVEFLRGHIEDIPLADGHIDVVISNCVINLSADKARVLAEAFLRTSTDVPPTTPSPWIKIHCRGCPGSGEKLTPRLGRASGPSPTPRRFQCRAVPVSDGPSDGIRAPTERPGSPSVICLPVVDRESRVRLYMSETRDILFGL